MAWIENTDQSMKKLILLTLLTGLLGLSQKSYAQPNESEVGAWYMYFFNAKIKESPWGFQGDVQFRNWDLGSDLEQLLLRGGVTYSPKDANIMFTLGYGNITTGTYGDEDETTSESRIYQEALFPTMIGNRVQLKHRFRYEQRFVEDQDFRTRYRYNLFINVPLNSTKIDAKTVYLALYNEIFINGERNISDDRTVEIFDRNRLYGALGYAIKKNLKVQLGYMQQTTDGWEKDQIQVSLHHKW